MEATTIDAHGKRRKVSPGTKGSISEHLATAWLLQQGYDVFRNVSPNGAADLLAVDWNANETLRVDVKSEGFLTGKTKRSLAEVTRVEKNKAYDIRYLVVKDDGSCTWHSGELDQIASSAPAISNDNQPVELQWWRDKKTLQRFRTPGNHMSNKEWSFYCHWLVRSYPDFIVPYRVEWVRGIGHRHVIQASPPIGEGELPKLKKLFNHVFNKLKEVDAVDYVDSFARAA